MARYVVLSFDHNETAEKVVELLQRGVPEDLSQLATWAADLATLITSQGEVVALAPKPTLFCDCGAKGLVKRQQTGSRKGTKYGWWVHVGCGKPIRQWGESYKAVLSAAHNFLAEDKKGE